MTMAAADFVIRVISALEGLEIPYMVVGSFSSNVWDRPGQPRVPTSSLRGLIPIDRIASAIGSEFVLHTQISFETITATTRYQFQHRDTAFLIEMFLLSADPHDKARFARRMKGELNGHVVFVPTAEDVVITKLRRSLHGGRANDVDDVRNVLAV